MRSLYFPSLGVNGQPPSPCRRPTPAPARPAPCHTTPLNGVTSSTLGFFSSYVRDYLRLFFKCIFWVQRECWGGTWAKHVPGCCCVVQRVGMRLWKSLTFVLNEAMNESQIKKDNHIEKERQRKKRIIQSNESEYYFRAPVKKKVDQLTIVITWQGLQV